MSINLMFLTIKTIVVLTNNLSFHSFGLLPGQGNCCLHDCQHVREIGFTKSGIYKVTPVGMEDGFEVFCDMQIDGGGWTVFQRRKDGSENFYKGWDEYQSGFGNKTGEHWLGNLALHAITYQGHYELRIDLEDFEGEIRFAKYRVFRVKQAEELYKLTVAGYSGNAGDSFGLFSGMAFTTKDSDNDQHGTVNCAVEYSGAGWFRSCHNSNLNGLYLKGNHTTYGDGVSWLSWKGLHYSLKSTSMKIRRI